MFVSILLASVAESLVSFLASYAVILNERRVRRFVHWFISFAVGALLAVVFFDVLPESIELIGLEAAMPWALGGFLFFFALETLLTWYHHHHEDEAERVGAAGYLISIGDALHNFVDGVAIAFAFGADQTLGIITTVAILLHEIPQEVGDFVVLMHSGFSRRKALVVNVLVSLATLLGASLGYVLNFSDSSLGIMLALIAGNFLYLAASDLIPELRHKHRSSSGLAQISLIIAGVLLLYFLGIWLHE